MYRHYTKRSRRSVWYILIIIAILIFIVYIAGWAIYNQVNEHYLQYDPMLLKLKDTLVLIHPAARQISMLKGSKSFTINKKKVYMCLYDQNGKYYDYNHLVYVAIHELSHVITKSIGHTDEFHENFMKLLQVAETKGLYDPRDPPPDDYCMNDA